MFTLALLFAVGWAQTPTNPTCCTHEYWTGQCTACPGYWYQSCNSGYADVDQRGCGFLGCETKCFNSCRFKNYGCGCNNSHACHDCVAVSCTVGGFGEWGSCSNTCGGGKQRRTRSVTRNASCGGTACPALFEERDCNTHECTREPTASPTEKPTQSGPLVMYQKEYENGYCAEQSLKNSKEKNNVKECAEFCKDTEGCVYFAFRPSSKGNQNCALYRGKAKRVGPLDNTTLEWKELGLRTYYECTKANKYKGYTTYKMDRYFKMRNKSYKCHKNYMILDLKSCQNAVGGNVQVVATSSKILGCSERWGKYYFNTVDGGDHEGESFCHEDTVTRRPCGIAWGAWSACTKSCGSGTQMRTGSVKSQPTYGGTPCSAFALEQSRACNTFTCDAEARAAAAAAAAAKKCKSAWIAAKAAAKDKKKCKAINGTYKRKKCKTKSKLKCSKIKGKTADNKLLCLCIPGCAPETKKKYIGKKCKGTGTPKW